MVDNSPQRDLFPARQTDSPTLISRSQQKGQKAALKKMPGGNDNYYTEGKKSYSPSFKLGRGKSALANIPADTESFPVSTWFRSLLEEGVQTFVLNSQTIRKPSPPGSGRVFKTNGSNYHGLLLSCGRILKDSSHGLNTYALLWKILKTLIQLNVQRTNIAILLLSIRMGLKFLHG